MSLNKKIFIAREQDNAFRDYPEVTHEVPNETVVTVDDMRRKYSQKLAIDAEMILLLNGSPATGGTVLNDEDKLYAKYPAKTRG
jgi:hypothetical protein